MPIDPVPLHWSLVIATYQRQQILQRCLRLAAGHTRPPRQIIIVDASPDWQRSRDAVLSTLAAEHAEIAWIYVPAERRSAAAQRNQGIRLADAEIIFLIDDDSLMYPDCAAQIMRVYEADAGGAVAGVSPVHVPLPPDRPQAAAGDAAERGTTKRHGRLMRFVRRLLAADDIFVPYDEDFPRHALPPALAQLPVTLRPLMVGSGMTLRREVCLREPFEEILGYYAYGEDSDAGYRASRGGALVTALSARVCHIGAGGGRLDRFVVAALGALNPLVLHRLYSTDLNRSRRRLRRMMARRMLILLGKDLSQGRFALPNVRGMLYAWRRMDEVFARSPEELRVWYPQVQKDLVDQS
ncbi:MAG: glycosyltransferase [Tepidisphaeraceae bacterium]|jgi:GT2 family glycosyltransferase